MSGSTLRAPSVPDLGLLTVVVLAAATSGPITAAITVSALAVSFWRCGLAAAVTAPFGWPGRQSLRGAGRLVVLAGVMLAGHFATWLSSVRLTDVATATALVATQPVFTVLLARLGGARVSPVTWLGVLVALAGVVLVGGVRVSLDPQALLGDALALAGGAFAAAYTVAGERARRTVPSATYSGAAYAVAALVMLPVCVLAGAPLGGYSARDWWLIVALTGFAQLLGHSVANHVVRTTSATVVSLALLFEVPGATLVAWVWLGQTPSPLLLPAIALLLVGLGLVIVSATRATPTETPA